MATPPPIEDEASHYFNMLKNKIDSENKENKEKIAKLENEINNYKSLVSTYEEKIKNYEQTKSTSTNTSTSTSTTTPGVSNSIEDLIFEIQKQNILGLNLDTKILTTKEEQCFLRNVLLNEPNKIFNTQLIYRFTRDGYSFESFHHKVDYIKPLIIVVETQSGKKLAVTTESFLKSLKYDIKNSQKSFILGFNTFVSRNENDNVSFFEKEKEKDKKPKEAEEPNKIITYLTFGDQIIYFKNDMRKCYFSGASSQLKSNYYSSYEDNLFGKINSKDKKEFEVKEIEVFTYKFK